MLCLLKRSSKVSLCCWTCFLFVNSMVKCSAVFVSSTVPGSPALSVLWVIKWWKTTTRLICVVRSVVVKSLMPSRQSMPLNIFQSLPWEQILFISFTAERSVVSLMLWRVQGELLTMDWWLIAVKYRRCLHDKGRSSWSGLFECASFVSGAWVSSVISMKDNWVEMQRLKTGSR